MALKKELPLDSGLTATCIEMTVGQVRDWMKALEARTKGDMVGDLLHPDIRFFDLEFMTDLKPEHIDMLTQSDLNKIVETCKGLNPHFFGLMGRVLVKHEA